MIHFTPTLGIKETASNTNHFVKDNLSVFWDIFKPFIPFVLAATILDIVVTELYMPVHQQTGEKIEFPLGGLIAAYFFTCLAISWHRVVIHGADDYTPMNPFKPKKSELAFVGMGAALFVGVFFGGFILGLVAALIHQALMILVIPFIIVAVYAWTKFMFYFPAKATGRHISLKESYQMTTGYVWKMVAASFVAYLKLLLIMIAYIIAAVMVFGGLAYAANALGMSESLATIVLQTLRVTPIAIFFQPLFAVLWVTVLSNYYQYVLQHEKPLAND